MTDFEVQRHELGTTRVVEPGTLAVEDGQALLRIDAFALTTNNITYGVVGDLLQYWKFFPAHGDDDWGRIPAFGFADVVESRSRGVAEGTRVFGYFPMSQHLVVSPARADDRGFFDGSAHRQSMAATYNHYLRVEADVAYDAAREAQQMLLRPLFFTSFLIDDLIVDRSLDADVVVLSSASSKTAIAAAFQLAQHDGPDVIGLTSPGNLAFTESLGLYDRVLTYADAASAPGRVAVFVDIAGDPAVRSAVHERYDSNLVSSMIVGNTHQAGIGDGTLLPGAAPELFFAPAQVAKRAHEWGQVEFDRRLADAWLSFSASTDAWLDVRRAFGSETVEVVYRELLAGGVDPRVGHVVSMWPAVAAAR